MKNLNLLTPEAQTIYVVSLLAEYDNDMKNGKIPHHNPYSDRIEIMDRDNNITIEVPDYVRANAIDNIRRVREVSRDTPRNTSRSNGSFINNAGEVLAAVVVLLTLFFVLSKCAHFMTPR